MEYTKEKINELDKKKIVSDIVSKILSDDCLDDTEIKKIRLDDYGNCIHITFTGGVNASTIIDIGKAFGDDDPDVYAVAKNTINIVFVNTKYENLIG